MPLRAMLASLIFDLDGTLIDSLPGIADSLNRALTGLGHPAHPAEAVRGFIGNGTLELARRALPADVPENRAREVEAAFNADYAVTWPQGTAPYRDIPEALDELATAGARMAVLSNKPHAFTVEIVDRLFPAIRFDPVLGQRSGTPRKPEPEAALQICRYWQAEPAACRFIGDSTIDLATARAAGMPAIAVAWGYHDVSALQAGGAAVLVHRSIDLAAALGTG